MSYSKYQKIEGVETIHEIFSEIRQSLKIDHRQTKHGKLFDMLVAIESVNGLLDEAWKVGKLHNLSDSYMNQEFIKIVSEFGRLKHDLKTSFLKQKH